MLVWAERSSVWLEFKGAPSALENRAGRRALGAFVVAGALSQSFFGYGLFSWEPRERSFKRLSPLPRDLAALPDRLPSIHPTLQWTPPNEPAKH